MFGKAVRRDLWASVGLAGFAIFMAWTALSSGSLKHASPTARAELLDEIADALRQPPATGAPRAARAYDALFSAMSVEDLRTAAASSQVGLALHAQWQLQKGAARARFDPHSPRGFNQYLETETQLRVPGDWAVDFDLSFYGGRAETDRVMEYYFARHAPRIERAPQAFQDIGARYVLKSPAERSPTNFGLSVEAGTRATLADGLLRIVQGEHTLACDAKLLPPRASENAPATHCTALVGPERSWLAFSDDAAGPFWLYCIDTKSGRLRWKTQVWGAYPTGEPHLISGPALRHDVYLAAGKEYVAVFGWAFQPYVEVFRADSGEVVARFSTNCWTTNATLTLPMGRADEAN